MDSVTVEKFSADALRVVTTAQKVALGRKHVQLQAEHLLLAMIEVKDSIAARTLQHMTVSSDSIMRAIEFFSPPGQVPVTEMAEPLDCWKRALQFASQVADELGADAINSGHLLLGLLADQFSPIGEQILPGLGVYYGDARREVKHLSSLPL